MHARTHHVAVHSQYVAQRHDLASKLSVETICRMCALRLPVVITANAQAESCAGYCTYKSCFFCKETISLGASLALVLSFW